jgi:hypothetical protein
MFNNLLLNNDIPFGSKLHIFNAVMRSIVCYGAQVWGGRLYDAVEKVQRSLLKRVFCLPMNAPTYLMFLETDLKPIYLHTLKLHINFINRCINLPQFRYPKILLKEVIERKLFVYEDWRKLEESYDIPLDALSTGSVNVEDALEKVARRSAEIYRARLTSSRRCVIYPELATFNNYIYEKRDFKLIKWFMKARTELILLNKYSVIQNSNICSLCNMEEEEDVVHFIARCPVLREFRLYYLRKPVLERDELKELMNGRNWTDLSAYCKSAWSYRYFLVKEFNS